MTDTASFVQVSNILQEKIGAWNAKAPETSKKLAEKQATINLGEEEGARLQESRRILLASLAEARDSVAAFDFKPRVTGRSADDKPSSPDNVALDYWAAAQVDPAFKALCRTAAHLTDHHLVRESGGDGGFLGSFRYYRRALYTGVSQGRLFDKVNPDAASEPIDVERVVTLSDKIWAALKSVNIFRPHLAETQAEKRVVRQIAGRYKELTQNPETRRLIDERRKALIDSYVATDKELDANDRLSTEIMGARAVVARGEAESSDVDRQLLYRLAYLEARGIKEIEVREGEGLDGATIRAIDERKLGGYYMTDRTTAASSATAAKMSDILRRKGMKPVSAAECTP